jgi:hypothetical protein
MTTLKLIKWLTVVIVTPWLIFMIVSIYGGGEPFTKMGESIASSVQSITLKLSKKADTIKVEADELKEKITGKKTESKEAQESAPKSEPKEKKTKKKKRAAVRPAPATTDETQ